MMVSNEMSRFSHLFSKVTVLSPFHKLYSSVDWAINVYLDFSNAMRECKDRFVKLIFPSGLEHPFFGVETHLMGEA